MTTDTGQTIDESAVFRLPDLGEGLQDAEIVAWLVSAGDRVVEDQPLVTIDSEKAVLDVPSPRSGRIARVHGEAGDRIAVGAILVEFEQDEGAGGGAASIVGQLDEPESAPPSAAPPPATPATPVAPVAPPRAAPSVRALARQLGVDLTSVTPTGRHGEVTIEDVQGAASGAPGSSTAGAPEPLRGVRLAMARAMEESNREVPAATVMDEADVQAWREHEDVSVRLVRAIVAGARAVPALNAWYDSASFSRQLHPEVRIGVAVETEEGLFVVVLRDARDRDAADLRSELDTLEAAAHARTLRPDQLRGSTVSLSNFGTLAGRFAQLVLPPPQVAILGSGRIEPRVVARDDGIAVHRMLPLSLTFDHRAATGAEAAAFLRAVIDDLEESA